MKIFHLADLHLGKRVNEFSMLEDQEYILTKIIKVIDEEKPSVVIIAGDIYDKSVPSAEAVKLFDDYLVKLAKRELQVFIISGNHDSPERIAFGSRLIDLSGVHLSPIYNGKIEAITLTDDYGDINFYMLPFVKPVHVRSFFPDETIITYNDAIKTAIDKIHLDQTKRNILITHQFVTGATRSDSEEINVGGSDNIDIAAFDQFDYVALGHIHGSQNVGNNKVRYCGAPLKYSFSEAKHKKSITVLDFKAKDELKLKEIELVPKIDWMEIIGDYEDVVNKDYYSKFNNNSYMHITLTDENDIPDAIGKLRVIYPNLMKLDYDNTRTRTNCVINSIDSVKSKSPLDLFAEFYEKQNNVKFSPNQKEYVSNLIDKIWGREK